MDLKHTHRTSFVRSDYELAAIHVMLVMNGKEPNPSTIEAWEADFRGTTEYEKTLRKMADWLQKFRPGFVAAQHECGGQLCDQDGQCTTATVERKD